MSFSPSMEILTSFLDGKTPVSHDVLRGALISFRYIGTGPFSTEQEGGAWENLWFAAATVEWVDVLIELAKAPPEEATDDVCWFFDLFQLFASAAKSAPLKVLEKIVRFINDESDYADVLIILFNDGEPDGIEWLYQIGTNLESLSPLHRQMLTDLVRELVKVLPIKGDINALLTEIETG